MLYFICTGFAVNLDLILKKVADFNIRIGYLESDFLKQLITLKELEPKANCTKVRVMSIMSVLCIVFAQS